jgi:hypothetical protein
MKEGNGPVIHWGDTRTPAWPGSASYQHGVTAGDGSGSSNSYGAQHRVAARRSLNVAPTDGSAKFNTIRIPLIPVACWKLNDPAFAFDSSFVSPAFRDELTTLANIVAANQGSPAAIFGHCDPAGSDALNKTLGDRRATAIYAVLTRQPALWAELYQHPEVGDRWGLHAVQMMLASVPDGNGAPYYGGPVNGAQDAYTTDAVKRFQSDAGLSADGDPGPDTRKVLFGAYMDWLCTPTNSSPGAAAFRMQPGDFLGGTGAKPGDLPAMSLQSCGKLNPIVLLASSEMNQADTVSRNADDAANRRVILFFFPVGTKVDSSTWPCPKAKDPGSACKAQFWPDGDTRRLNGSAKRLYEVTHDTMACRFYDRFARRSPCEGGPAMELRIWLQDRDRQRMPNAPYRLTLRNQTRTGNADGDGLLVESRIPEEGVCTLVWGEISGTSSSETVYRFRRTIDVQVAPPDVQARDLGNLAYSEDDSGDSAVSQFDGDYPGKTVDTVHTDGIPKQAKG